MNKLAKTDLRIPNEVTIDTLSHEGRGVATWKGQKLFIEGALPGEKVTFQITKKRTQFYEARVSQVLSPSEERATPPCAHYGICGACNLQHLETDAQIKYKEKHLIEQLKHFGQVEPLALLPPLLSHTEGYRRKARLGVKFVEKKGKVLVGFREKAKHFLADLNACETLHPKIGKQLPALSQLIFSLGCAKHIPQIEVAIGEDATALVFRCLVELTTQDKEILIAFGQQNHFHIYLQPNSPDHLLKLWPADNHFRLSYSLAEEDVCLQFHPLDFTQINLDINRKMVSQAIQLLEIQSHESVLDLFCGIGNFSLPLAKKANYVLGIEGSFEMVQRGQENALHNQLDNLTFVQSNLMDETLNENWRSKTYDKILLDPPRTGAREILPFFKNFNAKRILYISCNPATLARDAGFLKHQLGYQLMKIGMINMFPHTAHTEAMALFELY